MNKTIKVVAICGSPHRGNTFNILNFLKEHNREINFKIIMLSEQHLLDCVGCHSCINNGEENCPLKDDRNLIINEMTTADATIFASPTYARTISALMKKFVERTSYFAHRPMFFGKYAMALATCSGFGSDLTCKYLRENFIQCGFQFVDDLELKTATQSNKEVRTNKQIALKSYEQLLTAIQTQKSFEPSLGQLVYFNIFKSISVLNKLKGWADYQFYKDKKDYYLDMKIPLIKNSIAKWIAKNEVKKMITKN